MATIADTRSLIARAVAGVLRQAQDGELPLSAWTLGLTQGEWLAMISGCFPELGALEPLPPPAHARVAGSMPPLFGKLVALILEHRNPDEDHSSCEWLARALSAACLGNRHLWQDLGLSSRAEVSALISAHFPELYAANTCDLKWKRFLFEQLAHRHGNGNGNRPDCRCCSDYAGCVQTSLTD